MCRAQGGPAVPHRRPADGSQPTRGGKSRLPTPRGRGGKTGLSEREGAPKGDRGSRAKPRTTTPTVAAHTPACRTQPTLRWQGQESLREASGRALGATGPRGSPPRPPDRVRRRGDRLDPPPPLRRHRREAKTRKREGKMTTPGFGETTPPARPRAPERERPGAHQGHHGRPGEARQRAPPGGQGTPPPHRGAGRAGSKRTGPGGPRPSESCPLRQGIPKNPPEGGKSGIGPGSAPLNSTPGTRTRGGRRSEGPAGRARRAVPSTRNVRPSSGAA